MRFASVNVLECPSVSLEKRILSKIAASRGLKNTSEDSAPGAVSLDTRIALYDDFIMAEGCCGLRYCSVRD